MWNLISGNANMNKFERLMNHRGHLERLIKSKKVINTEKPKIPSFIFKKETKLCSDFFYNFIVVKSSL